MTKSSKRQEAIWIFGTVPEPVGGVSVFLQRLIQSGQVTIAGLLDPYFGSGKVTLAIPHWRPKKRGYFHRLLTMMKLFYLRDQKLFINGSRADSVLMLHPFLLFRSAEKSLLLHHGDLHRSIKSSCIKSLLVKCVLRGYAQIFCLSENQRQFYISSGVDETRLILVNSYIGVSAVQSASGMTDKSAQPDYENMSAQAREAIDWVSHTKSKVIIGSGYAEAFYNHEWVLDSLQQDNHSIFRDARYILCCYGPETEYLQHLRNRFSTVSNAKLCFGLLPEEFNAVLSRSSIYVRPTSIDSFGIAIHDALAWGLQVIASDACERPAGTLVHKSGNSVQFTELLAKCLSPSDAKEETLTCGSGNINNRINIVDAINRFICLQ